ncbi:MAG: PKD domain-containing protein [Flavobacteriales bacterium]|nr:PKD domain-containing protein [Flavobacteriales bacterium]
MKRHFRALACACPLLFAALAHAQEFAVTVNGNVEDCTPGQSVTVMLLASSGSTQSTVVSTGADCSYSAGFTIDFTPGVDAGVVVASTTCGGGEVTMDSVLYNEPSVFFPDTAVQLDLSCSQASGCHAVFSVQQAMGGGVLIPWQITTTNLSTGNGTLSYSWWMPDGSTSTAFEPGYTFTQAGVYGICLTITNADSSCTDYHCDTVVVDTNGYISANAVWYDCMGVVWGPNTPGTACDDGNPMTDSTYWNADCACVGAGMILDCQGIPGGSALPGTPCTVAGTTMTGTWTLDCVCVVVDSCTACINILQTASFAGLFTSCTSGSAGGEAYLWDFSDAGAQPGDSVVHSFPGPGTYTVCLNVTDSMAGTCSTCENVVVDADGNINPTVNIPCEASFWVIQAYDSTAGGIEPIPNEVWVWNLSSGGNGNYQFSWDFGDGTTSTEAFPSHTYDGPGPWLLCLTMVSGDTLAGGCTDIYCDSVSVDENGILVGMAPVGGGHPVGSNDRSGGFTLNVVQGIGSAISEVPAVADLKLWPNPVEGMLNISWNGGKAGAVPVEVIAADGRVLLRANHRVASGQATLLLPTHLLDAGLYMVRIGDGMHSITQRFLKVNP